MKSILLPGLLVLLLQPGCGAGPGRVEVGRQPVFRVRSDFTAALNANHGWAGALNGNVTIQADRPFRVRFEVEPTAGSTGSAPYRLQFRRNAGDWTDLEAHDFPYPVRELDLNFGASAVGAIPDGWRVAQGNGAGLSVAADGPAKVLRAEAGRESLVGLYPPPWAANEFAAQFRLRAGDRHGLGFVFGYVDGRNHCRLLLDPAAGTLRVSRFVDGTETAVTEKPATITLGEWLDLEFQTNGGEVEINYEDGTLEFTARLGADIPPSPFGFQVPVNGFAEFREFALAGEARTPRASIVSCPAYEHGTTTTDLLPGSIAQFRGGAGITLTERTPSWSGSGSHGEFEWAVVVRRHADGAVTNDAGDTFELRMVEAGGAAPVTARNPVLTLAIPPGHVGGTYVEAPGQIGPWQASNGDLYFIMEPTETYNVFMMMKSSDQGRTWREVDGANRPLTDDLESVDGRRVGDTIHVIHQVTNSTRYHTFRTSDHPTRPDTWDIRDEVAARASSIAQAATLVVRTDGSLVTFYVADTVHYSVRSPGGAWGAATVIDPGVAPKSAGPKAVLGTNDTVHLAYYGLDGTVWYRRLLPNGTLTERERLAAGLGTTRAEYGAVLPLVFIPPSNTVVIIYRQADGKLWERRIINDGVPTPAVPVTDRAVVQDAVDSQQPAADAYLDGGTVHVLFVEESSRDLFSTNDRNGWQRSELQVANILGSWVRGTIYRRQDGVSVYGYVYDAGSHGGAGMNRFAEQVLDGR